MIEDDTRTSFSHHVVSIFLLVISILFTITTYFPKKPSAQNAIGNSTSPIPSTVSSSNLVSIVQGSSSPNNSKFYDPSVANLTICGTVRWINKDTTIHTVTSISNNARRTTNAFNSKTLLPGQTFRHIFNHLGTIDYYCAIIVTRIAVAPNNERKIDILFDLGVQL
jgi:plastocyanin